MRGLDDNGHGGGVVVAGLSRRLTQMAEPPRQFAVEEPVVASGAGSLLEAGARLAERVKEQGCEELDSHASARPWRISAMGSRPAGLDRVAGETA